MKYTLLSLIIVLAPLLGLAAHNHHPEDHFAHLPTGGRKALHGMVLFGSGPYFLEHIPMLTPPHDFQIIVQASLFDKNGSPVTDDFSMQGFTLKPDENFSLNDYVAGRLKKFSASIYSGSFEQDGQPVAHLQNVVIEISEYKVIRQLPSQAKQQSFVLSDGKTSFVSNVITPTQNIQQIINATTGQSLWCVQGPDFFEPCR